jgi:hypothetical protein
MELPTVCFSVLLPDAQDTRISGFCREVGKNCAVLGFLTLENGIDVQSRNIGWELLSARCVIAQKSAVLENQVFKFTNQCFKQDHLLYVLPDDVPTGIETYCTS